MDCHSMHESTEAKEMFEEQEVTSDLHCVLAGVAEEARKQLREKWLLNWPQFHTKLESFMKLGDVFHNDSYFLVTATYLKLVPNEEERDLRALYFGSWLLSMVTAMATVTDDIVDDSAERFKKPSVPCKIGRETAICMNFCVQSAIYDVMEDVFEGKPYLAQFRKAVREYGQRIVGAILMDVSTKISAEDRLQRLSWDWFTDRVNFGCSSHIWILLEFTFVLACKPIDSDAAKLAKELAQIVGGLARVANDVQGRYEDADDRIVTWATMKALETNKPLIEAHYSTDEPETGRDVRELMSSMKFEKLFAQFELEQREKFQQILTSNLLPRKAWENFYQSHCSAGTAHTSDTTQSK